jgi:hypothetical protein
LKHEFIASFASLSRLSADFAILVDVSPINITKSNDNNLYIVTYEEY